MNSYLLIIILIFTLLGSYGSYCFKKASGKESVLKIIFSPILYIGGGFYLISLIMNIYTLKYMPYNIVFPLTSLTYIWTLILARVLLKEKVTRKKIIGIILLCLGALCMVL
ncbi:MAG: EamA family transporter [Clostridiales bacterium]|nr:EamA family transporter [Clostridiales bacterium]